jgi:hypothetical protein
MPNKNYQINLTANYTISGRTLARLQQLVQNSRAYSDQLTIKYTPASVDAKKYLDATLFSLMSNISSIVVDGS